MAAQKTILSIEVYNKDYRISYTGGFRPDWDDPVIRKRALKHDGRIMDALIACPEAFNRIAGFVHAVERFKQREAKKQAKQVNNDSSSAH